MTQSRVLLALKSRRNCAGPADAAAVIRPPVWLLDQWGDEQPLTGNLAGSDEWETFVAETGLLFLLGAEEPISDDLPTEFIRNCAIEMGWQSTIDGITEAPSLQDVSWTFIDAGHVWDICRLTEYSGDWSNRRIALTEVGRAAALSYLRYVAAGAKSSPW